MKLNQLRTFLAVVETSSIHGGARALGISQPAVSAAVRGLEKLLGAPLFRRSSLGIELTEYGTAFAVRARALVEDMRRAHEEIAQLKTGESGVVTVALSSSTASRVYLPDAFARFRQTMPNVAANFNSSTMLDALEQLRRGSTDFAVIQSPQGYVFPDTVEATPLAPLPLVIGARKQHPLQKSKSIVDLVDATWLMPGRPAPGVDNRFGELFARYGCRAPKLVIHCQSNLSALAMMQAMDFVSIFAKPMAALEFMRHGLQVIHVKEELAPLVDSLVIRRDAILTAPAAHFVQCLKDTYLQSEQGLLERLPMAGKRSAQARKR